MVPNLLTYSYCLLPLYTSMKQASMREGPRDKDGGPLQLSASETETNSPWGTKSCQQPCQSAWKETVSQPFLLMTSVIADTLTGSL